MSEPKKPPTVAEMLSAPDLLQRQMRALAEQQFVIANILPPTVLTRRERARGWALRWINEARESIALRIAPWLEQR